MAQMYTLTGSRVEQTEVTVCCIGGGSRDWAMTLINDLARCTVLEGEVRLYDVDHESARQNERLGTQVQQRTEAVGNWTYEAVETMADALDGADFVLLSTQDPPAETMTHDLDIPAECGLYQPVGDTVGPGGTVRAMRAIPQYREIAAGIRENCPDAWVLNFTNPMSVVTRTLYEEFPGVNAVGICHEIYHAKEYLATLVEDHFDAEALTGDDIAVDVGGINHFTWFTDIRWQGRDVSPAIDREIERQRPLPGGFEPGDLDDASVFVNNHQVAFDLYERFGVFPSAGDRHLVEFVPWYLDLDDPRDVQRWGIRMTPSSYRTAHWPDREATRQAYLDGNERFEFTDSGEELVDIMAALAGVQPLETNLNLPNDGQLPGVANGAVVETNALVTAGAVTPLVADELPPAVRSIVGTHVTNQETLVEAGFDGDTDLAFRAFLNDPQVVIQPDEAEQLFADLLEVQASYLDAWE